MNEITDPISWDSTERVLRNAKKTLIIKVNPIYENSPDFKIKNKW